MRLARTLGAVIGFMLQQLRDLGVDLFRCRGGVEALHDVAVAVDQELGEVPLDIAGGLGAGEIVLLQQVAQAGDGDFGGVVLRAGGLEKDVDGVGARAVHLDLGELVEGGVVLERAEGVDLVVAAGRLVPELVAGEVEDLEPGGVVLGVELLQPLVLRREAAARGGVDDEQDLALQGREVERGPVAALGREVVDGHCGGLRCANRRAGRTQGDQRGRGGEQGGESLHGGESTISPRPQKAIFETVAPGPCSPSTLYIH